MGFKVATFVAIKEGQKGYSTNSLSYTVMQLASFELSNHVSMRMMLCF